MAQSEKLEADATPVESCEETRTDRERCEHGRLLEALDAFLETAQWDWARPELTALYQARRELSETNRT